MIDEIYNSRIDAVKTYHVSGECEKTAVDFEEFQKKTTISSFKLPMLPPAIIGVTN
jgi:hypothetical protein